MCDIIYTLCIGLYVYIYMNQSGVKHIKTAPISGDNAFNKMASLHTSIEMVTQRLTTTLTLHESKQRRLSSKLQLLTNAK